MSAQVRKADDNVAGKIAMDLVELSIIDDTLDHFVHVVRAHGLIRYQVEQLFIGAVEGIFRGPLGRIFLVVLRDEREQPADGLEAFQLAVAGELRHAGRGCVHVRAAQPFHVDGLVRDRLHHIRAGHEHVADAAHHVHEVRDGRRVHGATRAGTENGADLGNHAGSQRVAQEDVGVAAQADHTLLDASAARIVQADDRRTRLEGEVHDLDDLFGVRLRQRTAEDGEILAEYVDGPAVNRAVAGDHAITQEALIVAECRWPGE